MHHARSAHAVVSTGDAIYAIGGTGEGGAPVHELERFDGREWRDETTLPGEGLNAPAAVAIGRKIFVIGGFKTVTNVPTSEVLVYDVVTHAWSSAAPLNALRGGHAAAVVEGKIHVIGGGNSRSTLADHSEYDPATNGWTERAPLSRSKGSPAAVVFGGRLYSIGGRSGPSDFGDVEIYDASTDRWVAGPPIEPRGTAGAAVYCGAIYVFGGESQAKGVTLDEVLRLDGQRATWSAATPMRSARNYARAVAFKGSVYLIGGNAAAGDAHSAAGSTIVERFESGCRDGGVDGEALTAILHAAASEAGQRDLRVDPRVLIANAAYLYQVNSGAIAAVADSVVSRRVAIIRAAGFRTVDTVIVNESKNCPGPLVISESRDARHVAGCPEGDPFDVLAIGPTRPGTAVLPTNEVYDRSTETTARGFWAARVIRTTLGHGGSSTYAADYVLTKRAGEWVVIKTVGLMYSD